MTPPHLPRRRRPSPSENCAAWWDGLAQQISDHVRRRAGTLGLTAVATALREMTAMTMRELAERMSCEPSNATFVIDKARETGPGRTPPPDRPARAKHLVLTAEGTHAA
ncbi:MarR family transcriptional regulator [Streptomyces sp. KL116D]|uniref:MarR family transcriptional regulator n=1 Tax=Streptomyces sp. KL116D TaxID=3045152 RepID=UPI00355762E9